MRRSRKTAFVAMALAGALALAVSSLAAADSVTQGAVTQSMEVAVSPTKAVKKSNKKTSPTPIKSLKVDLMASANNNTTLPPGAHQVDLALPEEFVFNNSGLPAADDSKLATQTTDQARSEFKDSQVGTGTSLAACGSAGGAFATFPGTVTLFNGTKGKSKPSKTLKLYIMAVTDLPTGPFTTILTGTLGKDNVLRTPVQPLGGGACSIQVFKSDIGKSTKVKGDKVSYVSATCKDKSWDTEGTFEYDPNPYGVNSITVEDKVTCKPKG